MSGMHNTTTPARSVTIDMQEIYEGIRSRFTIPKTVDQFTESHEFIQDIRQTRGGTNTPNI